MSLRAKGQKIYLGRNFSRPRGAGIGTPREQDGLGGLNFPLATDPDGAVSWSYEVDHEGRRPVLAGRLLFELATGEVAFPGPHLLRVLDQIRLVECEALAAKAPEPFAILLRALLIPEPARRTLTMREVANVLGIAQVGLSPDTGPCLTVPSVIWSG